MVSKKVVGGIVAIIVIAAIIGSIALIYTPKPTTSEQVTVIMPFVPLPVWNAIYAGIENGYYAEEGLNISITYTPEGSFGAIKQVGTGNIMFGIASGDSIITARSQGIPVVAIYQIEHQDLFGIIVKADSNITTPKDLEGKSIAIPGPGSPPDIAAKAIMKNSGADYTTVNFIPVGAALVPALLENKADAIAAYIEQEEMLKREGVNFRTMYAKDYGANLVTLCVITSEDMINNNPELVEKFLRATHKGYKWATSHPEEAVDIFVTKFNPAAAEHRDMHLAIWKRNIEEVIQPDKYPLGQFNKEQWETTQNILYDIGVITKKIDINKAYTEKFLKAIGAG